MWGWVLPCRRVIRAHFLSFPRLRSLPRPSQRHGRCLILHKIVIEFDSPQSQLVLIGSISGNQNHFPCESCITLLPQREHLERRKQPSNQTGP